MLQTLLERVADSLSRSAFYTVWSALSGPNAYNLRYYIYLKCWKNISKHTQWMPLSWNIAFSRQQKKEGYGKNNDKTNSTYEKTDA